MPNENKRETGARIFPAKTEADANDDFSQKAAENRRPPGKFGLSEPVGETNDKTRHSDGQNPRKRVSPEIEEGVGAGASIAEHSKDAKTNSAGRQAGANKRS